MGNVLAGLVVLCALGSTLAVLARALRRLRVRGRYWLSLAGMTAAVSLVFFTDWPIPRLNDFWAQHSLLSGGVISLLLLGSGLLAIDTKAEAAVAERANRMLRVISGIPLPALQQLQSVADQVHVTGPTKYSRRFAFSTGVVSPVALTGELRSAIENARESTRRATQYAMSVTDGDGPVAAELLLYVHDLLDTAVEVLDQEWADDSTGNFMHVQDQLRAINAALLVLGMTAVERRIYTFDERLRPEMGAISPAIRSWWEDACPPPQAAGRWTGWAGQWRWVQWVVHWRSGGRRWQRYVLRFRIRAWLRARRVRVDVLTRSAVDRAGRGRWRSAPPDLPSVEEQMRGVLDDLTLYEALGPDYAEEVYGWLEHNFHSAEELDQVRKILGLGVALPGSDTPGWQELAASGRLSEGTTTDARRDGDKEPAERSAPSPAPTIAARPTDRYFKDNEGVLRFGRPPTP